MNTAQTTNVESFKPIPIADLLREDKQYIFIIPSFQRGYRWEEKQVTDLLDDIKQFADADGEKNNSYFLQPVVVRATKTDNGKEAYEVLDGQQRLTTMLLILKRLMKRLSEDEREMYERSLYKIDYSNRPQLGEFDTINAADNIDNYYLSVAKEVIDGWFNDQKYRRQNLNNFAATLLYNQARQVKIIWYVIDDNSDDLTGINIFNRLNKGKIPLTSSELIKALFIMDCDQRADGNKLQAERLSMEWNEMERRFQDDKFWYFVSDDSHDTQTRMDVLFDFVTRRKEGYDTDYSYREFQKLYDFCRHNDKDELFESEWSNGIHDMEDAWKQVRITFDRIVAWYEDNLYYHYIGYLIAVNFTPLQIYDYIEEEKSQRKKADPEHEWTVEDTERSFRKKIQESFKLKTKEEIDELEYKSLDVVRRILLLFNVESCRKGDNIRFAFDKYKKEEWDVEHVEPQNNATLQGYDDRMRWLKDIEFILGKYEKEHGKCQKLIDRCKSLQTEFEQNKSVTEKKYKNFYSEVIEFFSERKENGDSDRKDFIDNLTLLDSATNREYKDAPFGYKRYCIIEKDKAGKKFIPICTRNLFLKYYTTEHSSYLDTMRWCNADRKGYMNALHEAIDPILFEKREEQK